MSPFWKTKMPTNIRPGVCGICGTAVVQPEAKTVGWHSGHLFEPKLIEGTYRTKLVLARVRCMNHKEAADPRHYDDDGNVTEHRSRCFGC